MDSSKRTYGLLIDNKIFLCSLVDLPAIIEAQKTLDYKTFYKSVDVSQMLFVHDKIIEDVHLKSPEELIRLAKEFNPLDDQQFLNNIYQRQDNVKKVQDMKNLGQPLNLQDLKFRHGLAPVTKNFGFADNVEEELLDFDEQGQLVNITKGAREKKEKIGNSNNIIKLFQGGAKSLVSDSNYQSQYSQSINDYYDEEDDSNQYDDQSSAGGFQMKPGAQVTGVGNKIQIGLNPYQQEEFKQPDLPDKKEIKSQYKQVKSLVKQTKADLQQMSQNQQECGDLRNYYYNLLDQKKQLKEQKKMFKQYK